MQTKEHPDELTPREREVFDLLRLGLTNDEIAARLGISPDGAKYHVSQILSKLGVSSREEAALYHPVAEAFQPRRRWWVALPLLGKGAGIAVVAGAVGGLGVLGWSVLAMGGEAEDSALTVDGPRIGDHWHAPISITACAKRQVDVSVPHGGIRTQGDSILHIQPAKASEEGLGASLVKWFEYGGGLLTDTEMRVPGSDQTFRNGDLCEGDPGQLEVYVVPATEALEQDATTLEWEWERLQGDALMQYIPQDGDRISIAFRSLEEPLILGGAIIIPDQEATRTIEIVVTDDGTDESIRFEPDTIEATAGETVKIVVRNEGQMSHGLHVSGEDGEFVSIPRVIEPGAEGFTIVRLNAAGEVEFFDDNPFGSVVTGVIVVR
jgi:DNA-binding CsgD family transcriptional regulator/plastocyanin